MHIYFGNEILTDMSVSGAFLANGWPLDTRPQKEADLNTPITLPSGM